MKSHNKANVSNTVPAHDVVTILYYGEEVKVNRAIADFLEADRKREQAQERSDRRYLSDKNIDRADFDQFLLDKPADFVDCIADADEAAYLRKMLENLTDMQYRRVQMHFYDGLTYEQIAEVEGVDESAIRNSIGQAIRKLRKYF